MSARILYTLSDENPDFHSKNDCMNESKGNRLLRGVSIASYSHHTKLTQGQRHTRTTGREPGRTMHEIMEKPASKAASKNQKAPSESSRSSVSSSWSRTSFSSADTYPRPSQPEPPFFSNGMFQETRQWSRSSHGLRDVVKDAIHREALQLMTMNTSEGEKMLSPLKYIDSPRPFTQAKSTKNRVSLHDGSSQTIPLKDTPRFAYDKREMMRPSSMMRLQELPRQSLQGKEQSMRSCGRQNHRLEDQHKQCRSSGFLKWQQEPKSQGRASGVVAKLMGLEVQLPGPDSTQRFSRTYQNKYNCFTSSLKHINSEAAKPGVNIADYKKASGLTSNSLLKFHKKQTSRCAGSKKANEKQAAEDRASSPSLRIGSSSQPLHDLKKKSSLRALEMERALRGHHSPISDSGERPRNYGLQQKKLRLDQQHHQALPSTGSTKTARHQSKGQKESVSPIRKPRPRLQIPKQPETRTDQIDQSHKGYTTSLQSESNRRTPPFTNADIARKYEHEKAGDTPLQYSPKQKNSNPAVGEEIARQDHFEIVQEQPSPVSVLDAIFYEDEPLSPVKKIPNVFKDEEHLNSDEASRNCKDQRDFSNSRSDSLSSENGPSLLLANSMPEEFAVQEATVNESRHKEHKYISEILAKSGILEDPESNLIITQLHPSRLPLDPEFFLALEQGKERMEVPKDGMRYNRSCQTKVSEKIKRKLIFDTVNEILAHKIVLEGVFKERIPQRVLAGKRAKGHMILQTVFSAIDRLQAHNSSCKLDDEDYSLKSIIWEDLMHRERQWTDLQGEIPGIVLDVERLIFKDLIGEIISGDRAASKARTHKHHRRLFST